MVKVGVLCTNQTPTLRPAMSDVVGMLEGRISVEAPIMNMTIVEGESSGADVELDAIVSTPPSAEATLPILLQRRNSAIF